MSVLFQFMFLNLSIVTTLSWSQVQDISGSRMDTEILSAAYYLTLNCLVLG